MPENPITVLVVDDEASLRRALVRGLSRAGYLCREAGSGVDALTALEQELPDLVISDLRMPGMDGVRLLDEIHRRWPDVCVIMATAVAEVETAVDCLRNGAMDYLAKPFQLDEVRVRVEQALEKRRLIVENRLYHEHLAELVDQQAARIEELFLGGVQMLVDALEAKDAYTRGHSTRVSAYAGAVGRALGLSDLDVQVLELGAELHDIGKIGVREEVLHKPGRLSKDEYDHLMAHTTIGARILAPLMTNARAVVDIVRSHHERFDGSGSPDRLRGDAIPLPARIVAACDAFDAMTSQRPYRDALPAEFAVAELERVKGTQFDAEVVRAFMEAFPDVHRLPIPTPPKVKRRIPSSVAWKGMGQPAD